MASGSKNSSNDVVLDLEAMRKDDSSWHPCQVSLCPSGVGLIVDYGYNDSEDIILDKEEALTRLRVRSLPLQGDDCASIKQGEHVLATQDSQNKSPFFDAEVEKVNKTRHSKRAHCRCTFMVKWLHQDSRGTVIVPSSSIMKLATKDITAHPTISSFFNTLNYSTSSPLPTLVKDVDFELDLHELLEKQIEEISNSVDASKKKITEDLLLGDQVPKGQVQSRTIASSKRSQSQIQAPSDQNSSKRSTRSRNNPPTEAGPTKDSPMPAPSIKDEFLENKSPLNPLAARAALASLMSKLPGNLEFSIYHEEKCFTYSSDVTMGSLNGTKPSFVEAAAVPFVPKHDNNVKSIFSTKEWENENKTQEKRKKSQPTKATRLSRASRQKGIGIHDDDIERETCAEEMKSGSGADRKRLTRLTIGKEEEIQTIETPKVKEETVSAKHTKSNSSKMVVETKNSSNTRRLIRSAVTESKPVEDNQRLNKKKNSEHVKLDISGENITDLESNVQERDKKMKISNAGKTTKRTEGNGLKRKLSESIKLEFRSSPRLRSLQTRSQNKT